MKGYSKTIIAGNVGKDPEIRYAQSGMAMCTFSVAVNTRKKDGDDWKEHTEWYRVKAFGKTAENVGQYLNKGSGVLVEGRMEFGKYTDKGGVERYTADLIADTVVFLPSGEKDGAARPPRAAKPAAGGGGAAPPASDSFIDDDLPFIYIANGLIP